MNSIYETIMGLPLFKGASNEVIHAFVEKTPLSFSKYDAGSIIVTPGMHCDSVKCLLSGRAKVTLRTFGEKIEVTYTVGPEIVFGIEHLLGLDTNYGCRIAAESECGVMEFPKKHYLQLVRDNHLLLINYLNYLSMLAQRGPSVLAEQTLGRPFDAIRLLVSMLTPRNAIDIEVRSRIEPLCRVFGNPDEFRTEAALLESRGAIHMPDDRHLRVLSVENLKDPDMA